MPIANNLELRKYGLGDVILKAGEVPRGLYFVKKGMCRVGLDVTKY
jgi:CRP-like cAMP-binding protein